jgi:glycosyltransferase 2 family protein
MSRRAARADRGNAVVRAGGTAQEGGARPGPERRFSFARHPADLVRLAIGLLLLVLASLPVRRNEVGTTEENLFRLVNDLPLPGWLWPFVWAVMQLGNLGAVPATAALAAATRRWRLAFDFAVAGGTIWILAKVVKDHIQRGRPAALLDDVHLYGGAPVGGLGYVSGHAAVATALATVASPFLGRRGRRIAWTLAAAVCVTRVWVGAHLPLDVIGGAALGWVAGVIVHLLLGAPGGRPSTAPVMRALTRAGLDPLDVQALGGVDAPRAAYFVAGSGTGHDYFVKYLPRERRDNDVIARAWRRVRGAGAGAGRPTGPPAQQVRHEAAVALLAQAAGVRTPAIVLASEAGGDGLLVQHWVPGRMLGDLAAADVDDDLLRELWRQVGILHRARIAHGDLGPGSVVVNDDRMPWLVDFSHARAAADAGQLDRDVTDLLAALGPIVGRDRAAAAAAAALDPDTIRRATA